MRLSASNNVIAFTRLIRVFFAYKLFFLIPTRQYESRIFRTTLQILKYLYSEPSTNGGSRLREALIELGPIYIKVGQLISTRKDLFPRDICSELSLLQDSTPPIQDFDIYSFLRDKNIDTKNEITDISRSPIASASIAQVHSAKLKNGERVVLKVVRPGVEKEVRENMAFLKFTARLINKVIPTAKRFRLYKLAQDQEDILLKETDMYSESRNQIQLRRNFADSDLLYVPRVFGQHTRSDLLVMERVSGISVDDIAELKKLNVDLEILANKGVETFFTQVFDHNFFHADMHPGNIFVDASLLNNPKYIALDCAIMGTLSKEDKMYIAQSLMAFFDRNYLRIAELQIESGWISPDVDLNLLEKKISIICEPIFNQPLSKIFFGQFLADLFSVGKDFQIEIQPQLILLQKTLLYIEGLGRQLYPELDLWKTAKPFMRRWITNQLGLNATFDRLLVSGPGSIQKFLELPQTTEKHRSSIQKLKKQITQQEKAYADFRRELQEANSRNIYFKSAGLFLILLGISQLTGTNFSFTQIGNLTNVINAIMVAVGTILLLRR